MCVDEWRNRMLLDLELFCWIFSEKLVIVAIDWPQYRFIYAIRECFCKLFQLILCLLFLNSLIVSLFSLVRLDFVQYVLIFLAKTNIDLWTLILLNGFNWSEFSISRLPSDLTVDSFLFHLVSHASMFRGKLRRLGAWQIGVWDFISLRVRCGRIFRLLHLAFYGVI